MSSDLDDLLAELGAAWSAAADPIDLDEVVERPPTALRIAPPGGRHRSWWLVGAAAAVAATVVAATLVVDRDDESPTLIIPPTPATTVPDPTDTTPAPTPSTTVPTEPATGVGAWSPVGQLPGPCLCSDFTILDDGRVLILGAVLDTPYSLLAYDPVTATFAVEAELPSEVHRIAPLADGRLVLTGPNGELQIYDPTTRELAEIRGSDPFGRGRVVAFQLPDGEILLFGSTTVQTLDAATGAISDRPGGTTSVPRDSPPTIVLPLPDGTLFVADDLGAERFDPRSGEFSPFDDRPLGVSWARPLGDGQLLLTRKRAGDINHSTEVFDATAGRSTPLGSWQPVAVLSDGRVLGFDAGGVMPGVPVTGAIHDLTTGTVEPIAPPSGQRYSALPVPLPGDRVLLVGGGHRDFRTGVDVDGSTAELFAIGDPGLPAGCCAPNPTEVRVSASWRPDGARPFAGQLGASLSVPAGALVGATEASWWAEVEWSPASSDGTAGGGNGRELSLPADCDRGCRVTVPMNTAVGETTTLATLEVIVAYEGPAPAAAAEMAIIFEP